ncbi:MAG: J domain-containing protein [Deltaproteobacteria bacterium]|nr:MAG: J domain-containing protein [Deltaproteobacteria bacterium]
MAQDYYSILGVANDASGQEIKKAFRQIARECHPDVAGDDPVLAERYKAARTAYETLSDPVTRGRYDRRGQRRAGPGAPGPGGSFFDAFYRASERRGNRTGKSYGTSAAGGHSSTKGARENPDNHLDLDDLFNDFGDFGFGGEAGAGGGRRRTRTTTRDPGPTGAPPPPPEPVVGDDVEMELDVPADIASRGGSVTAVYYRMQRADSWRPGSPDAGLVRVQDIADVRIVPGTRTGEMFRERGLGHAGPHGGPYGDLVVRVNVIGSTRSERRTREDTPRTETSTSGDTVVEISVVEAILGGRIELATPQGEVRITIPAGTSSDARLRLKGKGPIGMDGRASDLFVRVRIVVPKQLDAESRALIEEFGRLNPGNPRG